MSDKPYSYFQQLRSVLVIEALIIVAMVFAATSFWEAVCGESCLSGEMTMSPWTYLGLSFLRPFVLTPYAYMGLIAGHSFGPYWGALLTALGGCASTLGVFAIGKVLSKKLVKPWLRANLPATWSLFRSQDYKVIIGLRLLPFIPFDLATLAFGVLDFTWNRIFFARLIGALPEAYFLARLMTKDTGLLDSTLHGLTVFAVATLAILVVLEFMQRKRGKSLWARLKNVYEELLREIRSQNEITKRPNFDPDRPVILLLYGFFASRRTLTVLEKQLHARGFQVMSFNLGGVFGTFFTRSILETASFVDYKLKRQIDRQQIRKIQVVAHSKGGLVAIFWLLKLGGYKICDKVITMGTPFAGSLYVYLALVTPLGFMWRDVWQMRPGSSFLKYIRQAVIPPKIRIYCLHSAKDKVARGHRGAFRSLTNPSAVSSIAMDHVGHFEFLHRKDVADTLAEILKDS